MQKIQGPFRLHRRDQAYTDSNSVVELLKQNGVALAQIGECRFVQRYPRDWTGFTINYDYGTQNFNYLVRDCAGLIVPRWWIELRMAEADLVHRNHPSQWVEASRWRWPRIPRDEISTDWSVFRGHSGSGSCKYQGSYHMWRNPRTQRARREQERVRAELRDHGIRESSRDRKYLPTNYDDIYPDARRNRNWKQYRSNQYRD